MARKKPENLIAIADYNAADAVLALVAELDRQKAAIELEMNQRIDAAKNEAENRLAPIRAQLKQFDASLEAFGLARKNEFDKPRSRDLTYGTIGFRASHELQPQKGFKVGDIMSLLKKKFGGKGIRVSESWDKDECRKWSKADLDAIGAELVEKDKFFYEIKSQELATDKAAA